MEGAEKADEGCSLVLLNTLPERTNDTMEEMTRRESGWRRYCSDVASTGAGIYGRSVSSALRHRCAV